MEQGEGMFMSLITWGGDIATGCPHPSEGAFCLVG